MTRKRYIKLLMANGVSRNEANECASEARGLGIAYQYDYDLYRCTKLILSGDIDVEAFQESIRAATQRIIDAIHVIAEIIGKTVKAMCAVISAFSEAYQRTFAEA